MGGGKSQTIGYKYGLGLHIGVCRGPVNAFLQLRAGNRTAFIGSVTSNQQIFIDKPTLFGGDDKEGGLQGAMDVMFGASTQGANDYLQAKQAAQQPAYRGLFTLVWRGGELTSITPYLKTWLIQCQRTTVGWSTGVWYEEVCEIDVEVEADVYDDTEYFEGGGTSLDPNDPDFNPNNPGSTGFNFTGTSTVKAMNGAHIIYQALTDTDWGMGYPVSSVDDASFRAAALQLADEGFGMCVTWSRQESIEDFVQAILNTIGAALVIDPSTGNFVLKLLRYDYDLNTLTQNGNPLLVLDEDKIISLDQFQRSSPVGLVSEVTVTYVNANTGKTHNVTVQDLGMIQSINGIISHSATYDGVPNNALGATLAQRDLTMLSTPLAQLKITVGRWAYKTTPGDIVVLDYDELGLTKVPFRVGEIDYGQFSDGKISITAVEDYFGLPAGSYLGVQQSQWLATDPTAKAIVNRLVFELPYREIYRLGPAGGTLNAGAGFVGTGAQQPNSISIGYDLHTKLSGNDVDEGVQNWTPYGALLTDIPQEYSSDISLQVGFDDLSDVVVGTACMVGTEICSVTSVADAELGQLTIARGCVDTPPQVWVAGTKVFFYEENLGVASTEFTSGETVSVLMLTKTTEDVLEETSAPADTLLIKGRASAPYPPAGLKINDLVYPTALGAGSTVVLKWVERNRLTQANALVGTGESTITPEGGTTYTVKVYLDGVLDSTTTDIAGTTYTPTIPESGMVKIEIYSVCNSLTSYNPLAASFQYGATLVISMPDTDFNVGTADVDSFFASGGTAPYTYSLDPSTTLPSGMTFDATNKRIIYNGTTAAGTYPCKINVQDSVGNTGSATFTLKVNAVVTANFWRLNFTANNGAAFLQVRKMELVDADGTDQAGFDAINTFAGSYVSGYEPYNAIGPDSGDPSDEFNSWMSDNTTTDFLGCQFSSPHAITDVKITAISNSDNLSAMPYAFTVQYSLDSTDGTDGTWVDVWSEDFIDSWNVGEQKDFPKS